MHNTIYLNFLNSTTMPPKLLQTSPDMRQLWLDNEVLDENGVRNYMSSALHTPQKARITNSTQVKPAQQDPCAATAALFLSVSRRND